MYCCYGTASPLRSLEITDKVIFKYQFPASLLDLLLTKWIDILIKKRTKSQSTLLVKV